MAKLLSVVNVSLDGYIADEDGKLDWTAPAEEYFSFLNDLEWPVGTYLYGRRPGRGRRRRSHASGLGP